MKQIRSKSLITQRSSCEVTSKVTGQKNWMLRFTGLENSVSLFKIAEENILCTYILIKITKANRVEKIDKFEENEGKVFLRKGFEL